MKTKFLLSSFILSAVGLAENALITKTNYPGFLMPDYAVVQTCSVFADRVLIRTAYGQSPTHLLTEETRQIKMDSAQVIKLIEAAANSALTEKENGLCDGPSTYIEARGNVLFSTGGCGSASREREGFAAKHLIAVVDAYCPVTHKNGMPSPQELPPPSGR